MTEVDVASHRPAGEKPKQLRTSFKHGYDRVRSNDTFGITSYFGPSSELSGTIDYMSKTPTIRSSHAYYDGSVSSFDGSGIEISCYENPQDMAMLQLETGQDSRDEFEDPASFYQRDYLAAGYEGEITNNRYCIVVLQTGNSPHSCLCLSILIAEVFARSTPVTVVIVLVGLVPRVLSSLQTLSSRYATGKQSLKIRGMKSIM
ncbi:hypothetical protein Dsin_024737 [Dipteronia sinensis]|uniref:Uncharacterized protein n=1 Tax=Dipteronia sinensis TaxID=43782 RepID=A0AAE0DWA9_9ROSI|nr:hypothetical protein Dsin_024737 [Dipteronia sinensis]